MFSSSNKIIATFAMKCILHGYMITVMKVF